MTGSRWNGLAERVLAGGRPSRADGLSVLGCRDGELLDLLQSAFRVRERRFGRKVRLHILNNSKAGLCPEDCAYCSQSAHHSADIETYPQRGEEEMVAAARDAAARGAYRFCMVTATRNAGQLDLDGLCRAVRRIKAELPVELCCSLGALTADDARRLREAGVDRYNHNLETSARRFPEICTTHTFADRMSTVRTAREAGMEICCGGLVGMGETDDDLLSLAESLAAVGPDSSPINFLDPRPGTPLAGVERLTPGRSLRILCLYRFHLPATEIRLGGGREVNLRSLQPLALYPANAMFTRGYLTTGGQDENQDIRMILDAGFEVERPNDLTAATPRTTSNSTQATA